MLNLIYCELLKLKRSKILIISIIGVMATPCMMLAETLQTHFENPELAVTLTNIYSDSLLYIMILINMIIYVTITSYLFSREYTENSIKTILPIPVSRMAFITGKFIVLYLWSVMLMLVTWMGILIFSGLYHAVIGMDGFLFTVIFEWLCKFLMGNTLLYLTITPFAFIAEKTKGMVAPMIASAVIVMGSAAILNHDIGALYPWTATCLIMEGRIQSTGYPDFLVSGIIVVVSVVGFLITFQHFKKEDIK